MRASPAAAAAAAGGIYFFPENRKIQAKPRGNALACALRVSPSFFPSFWLNGGGGGGSGKLAKSRRGDNLISFFYPHPPR